MEYIKTENGNYLVLRQTKIGTTKRNKPVLLKRVAFFNKDKQFIKLVDIKKFNKLAFRGIKTDLDFVFPPLKDFHFVAENHGIRLFVRWKKIGKKSICYPSFYYKNDLLISIKYDIFTGKLLQKPHAKILHDIFPARVKNDKPDDWNDWIDDVLICVSRNVDMLAYVNNLKNNK